MSGTTSDSDAETVITEGTTDGGKVNKEKGKVSQIALFQGRREGGENSLIYTGP